MGIDFKAKLTAENFNNAFMCRNEDTDTTGRVKSKYNCTEKTTETAAATMDLATDTGVVEITGTGPVDITSFTSTIENGQQVTLINNTDGDITFSVFTGKTVTLPQGCSLFLIGCNNTLVPHVIGAGGGTSTGGKFVDGADPSQAVYTTGLVGIGETNPDCMLTISNQADGFDTTDPLCVRDLPLDNSLDQVLVQDANGVIHYRDVSTVGGAAEVWFIREQVSAGTNAPAALNTTWHTRQMLNIDLIQPWATIVAPGEFTLQPGTYCIEGSAPAFTVLRHQTRLYDVTNSTIAILGSSDFAKKRRVYGGTLKITYYGKC